MTFSLSAMQKDYWNNANHRWNIKCGATRSGKTWLDYYMIPRRIREVSDLPGHVILIGNTQATLERNVLEPMRNMYGDTLVGYVRNDNKVRLFGRECYALGADNKSAVKRIQGASIAYCYGDEVVTWSKAVFDMLKSRLDKPYSKFDGTCNPENKTHWFKTFLDSAADIFCQHYTIFDNPFLDPKFVEALKLEYLGTVLYNRYILGEWCNAEGLLFPQFADNPKNWEIQGELPRFNRICMGVDIGGTKSHSTLVTTGITMDFSQIVTFRESKIVHSKGTIDTERIIDEILATLESLRITGMLCRYIFVDNAEQVILNTINKAVKRRYPATTVTGCKKIDGKTRILIYNSMLNRHKMWFQGVPIVVESLSTALYDTSKNEDAILDDFTTDIDTFDAHFYSWSMYMTDIAGRR